jgi:hypothetical protein
MCAAAGQVATDLVHFVLDQVEGRDLDEGVDDARRVLAGLQPVPGVRPPAEISMLVVGQEK